MFLKKGTKGIMTLKQKTITLKLKTSKCKCYYVFPQGEL